MPPEKLTVLFAVQLLLKGCEHFEGKGVTSLPNVQELGDLLFLILWH